MKKFLYQFFFGRVSIQPALWYDWRKPYEIDRGWELVYRAKLNRNLFERGKLPTKFEADKNHIPEWLREPIPFGRQAI